MNETSPKSCDDFDLTDEELAAIDALEPDQGKRRPSARAGRLTLRGQLLRATGSVP